MFTRLDSGKIIDTAFTLSKRVRERFPTSGLCAVAAEVAGVSKESGALAADLGRPVWPLRVAGGLLMLLLGGVIVVTARQFAVPIGVANVSDLAQGIESAINDVIFAGIAVWFAFTIETRAKRRRALALIARLRSLAHVIDMHQLTKDPDRLAGRSDPTASSPKPDLSAAELSRYLDYCSEQLAILGKLAALCVQEFDDPVTLAAVDQLEDLTNGLSRKIWQKITIVNSFMTRPA